MLDNRKEQIAVTLSVRIDDDLHPALMEVANIKKKVDVHLTNDEAKSYFKMWVEEKIKYVRHRTNLLTMK